MAGEPLMIFPVLLRADRRQPRPGAGRSHDATHWRLVERCYDVNFREVPARVPRRADRDRRAARLAGVALQALGYGQVALWSALFAWWGCAARRS
jgi:hypothetical protein